MKKTLVSVIALATVLSGMTMGVAEAKPKPHNHNSHGTLAKGSPREQPAMSGMAMLQMRPTAKQRNKSVANSKALGMPTQVQAAATMNPPLGPDYFGASPNYASSPLPKVTWNTWQGHQAGEIAILPVFDPNANTLTNPINGNIIDFGSPYNPYKVDGTGKIVVDPINNVPQLDTTKVSVGGGIRKFIEPLTGVGAAAAGTTVQNCVTPTTGCTPSYVPVATPDTTTYPGSDYYVIGLKDYYQQFSPDLPPTKLRGYYQINAVGGEQKPYYLGPVISAQTNRPVRVKFVNNLSPGVDGDLFLPVDTTMMGDGMGPLGMGAVGDMNYKQNRATLHLHGGATPWISDGTPHQWTTPASTVTSYPSGVSVSNVPDMDGGNEPQGTLTFFYTNQQSARLMFYHDHTYGMTRLNVYAGEVAGYTLDDPQTKALVDNGTLPSSKIPLIIQDKAFVPDNTSTGYFPDGQLAAQDPTWNIAKWGGTGSLWFPHVYMPNQNPYDDTGAAAKGRWDYGPWFWPVFGPEAGLKHGEIPNPYYDQVNAPWEPPFIPGTPSTYTKSQGLTESDTTLVPEAFVDTPIVNGVAYPYMTVDPKAYRFQILNGANDRFWNLQMYCAVSNQPMWTGTGTSSVLNNANAGEVPMVPAIKNTGLPASWPTDDREGGVPDPKAAAGDFLQFANEGGVLPNLVTVAPQPVDYVYNRRDIVVLNIAQKSLLIAPAERADVVFDFSTAAAKGCTNVIMYNDAPAPVPAFDPRNDHYTNNPDQTDGGGTPSTLPGYGPNTRTIMQFRINPGTPQTYDKAKLATAIPPLFAATQPKPITPETRYAAAYPGDPISASNTYSRIQSNDITFTTTTAGSVASLNLGTKGSGYIPFVTITGGGGTGAKAVAVVDPNTGTMTINVTNQGTGYTSVPTVTISAPPATSPVRTQATALASISTGSTPAARRVTSIAMTNKGKGYTASASLTIANPPNMPNGSTATGTATVDQATGVIQSVTLTDPGYGYAGIPAVAIQAPPYAGGVQALATATMQAKTTTVTKSMEPKAIQELFEMDYGRMNATLGVELPFTNSGTQTTLPMGFAEPATEVLDPAQVGTQIGTTRDGTQIWKITHNGVDTHVIHFHLFNVQIVNRVGWDGAIRPPDDDELGWKESVRMSPLEDTIVALRPITPDLPFKITDSRRLIDPTMPEGADIATFDTTNGNPITVPNTQQDFGWEYVWHCHILGHEENDMMRPIVYNVSPPVPTLNALTPGVNGSTPQVTVAWTGTNNWKLTNYVIQRSTSANFTTGAVKTISSKPGTWQGTTFGTAVGKATTYIDNTVAGSTHYYYRVRSESNDGYSAWSNSMNATTPAVVTVPNSPTSFKGQASATLTKTVDLSWTQITPPATDSFTIEWFTNSGFTGGAAGSTSVLANKANGIYIYSVKPLTSGTQLWFRIRAVNASGVSAWTNRTSSITPR